jgi:hypothetical protein
MSQTPQHHEAPEPPAMGERRARWGYGYQDKVVTDRILRILKDDLRDGSAVFEGVRLADLQAGRVDDFVLVWNRQVEGNSIKWSGDASPMNWRDLIGAKGLLKELAQGFLELRQRWPDRTVTVRLQTNRPPSRETHANQIISAFSVAEFLRDYWEKGPTAQDAEVSEAWGTIAQHTGLSVANFGEFIRGCIFSLGCAEPPGSGPDTRDWRHYVRQFDALHKAIATWLTNNPDLEFINREVLFSAIGFRGYRSGLIQRFPPPQIPYEQNVTAADRLKQRIEAVSGGYIAVTGCAGIGKSTLVKDDLRLQQWMKMALARHWLSQRAIVGREAAMRLLGRRALSGRVPRWMERAYDSLCPLYDPALELIEPRGRPSEMLAMNWDFWGERGKDWLQGKDATDWDHYPSSVGGLRPIAERSWFIRPNWEWPREERYRGVPINSEGDNPDRESLASGHELTYQGYIRGDAQEGNQLIVWNGEH